MKALKPLTITDALLTYTNVDETIALEWDSGSTYDDDVFVYIASGTQRDIYESLQGSNLNKDPETETDWWVFRSTTYDEYAAGTTYGEGDNVIDATNHLIYESLQAGNTGNALTNTTWWLEVGATEPRKAFDGKVGNQTERTGSIVYEITPTTLVTGISLLGADAVSINITVTDTSEGEVYNEDIDLLSTENVYDAYTYCFAPFLYTKNVVKTDLPPYIGATISITITAESDTATAKCGEIVVGDVDDFTGQDGGTKQGAGFEIKDFSVKSQDAYGNFNITERDFSQKVFIDVLVDNYLLPYLKLFLEQYRATPVVWVPTEVENLSGVFLTYGYYSQARTVVPYPDHSIITIEIEGLT